jgi:hypothetical protein
MRSATFPPIRVEPEVRAEVEAVLREGESLTQFIEEAVVAAAAWRSAQAEFVTRGEAAIERWKQEGGGHTVDERSWPTCRRASMTPSAEPLNVQASDGEVHGHAAARSGGEPAAS